MLKIANVKADNKGKERKNKEQSTEILAIPKDEMEIYLIPKILVMIRNKYSIK